MYYIIQENLFKEHNHELILKLLGRMRLDYEVVRYIPFVHDIEFKTNRKDVWIFGSVNMAHCAHKYNWYPGSMYNENHDMEVYMKHWGKHMLNHDAFVMEASDELPESLPYAFFARPTKDTKAFSGQLFTKDAWNEWIQGAIKNEALIRLTEETRVLLAPLKDTQQEVRCWVVDGKVVTLSRYKLGSRVISQNYDDEVLFKDFAQKMVDIYQPARAFVLDVCLSNDELKIVEVNCINCSGFYDGDMNKLIQALEKAFV